MFLSLFFSSFFCSMLFLLDLQQKFQITRESTTAFDSVAIEPDTLRAFWMFESLLYLKQRIPSLKSEFRLAR